jgi:hypothetical protein
MKITYSTEVNQRAATGIRWFEEPRQHLLYELDATAALHEQNIQIFADEDR